MAGLMTRAVSRLPGLRRLPILKLLAIAEIAVLARDHYQRLEPDERRRLVELIRLTRGRPGKLSQTERDELAALVAKAEPRMFAGATVDKLSPVPLPKRVLYGRRRPAPAQADSTASSRDSS